MLRAVKGIVRDGKIELAEPLPPDARGSVVVTLLEGEAPTGSLLLSDVGISPEQAREIRAQLATFDEDWSAPGMDAYDRL